MRNGDAAWDNFGVQYESVLDGHAVWPCMNPKCRKRCIDPDSNQQYCSVSCENAVITNKNGASGMSHAKRMFASLAQQAQWVQGAKANGYIRSVDQPALAQPVNATLNQVRRLQLPVGR